MALSTNVTSITLRGTSSVETENGTAIVMTMSATIAEVGHSSDTYTVTNQELYEEHKDTVRKDKAEFIAKIQEIEDSGIATVIE